MTLEQEKHPLIEPDEASSNVSAPVTYLVKVNGQRVHEGSHASCEDWALAWNSSVSEAAGMARIYPLFEREQPAPLVPIGATHCTEYGWYRVQGMKVCFWNGSSWVLSDFTTKEVDDKRNKFFPIASAARDTMLVPKQFVVFASELADMVLKGEALHMQKRTATSILQNLQDKE